MAGSSTAFIVLLLLIGSFASTLDGQRSPGLSQCEQAPSPSLVRLVSAQGVRGDQAAEFPIALRPATLADGIDSLAGLRIRLTSARVVGVFDPRAFVVETEEFLRPFLGNRKRVLVFVESGKLGVPPRALLGSTVTVTGTARTLLGMEAGGEVAWPAHLTRQVIERLEVRAAVLATAVSTPDGVDLLRAQ
jgi:hypothetical protein